MTYRAKASGRADRRRARNEEIRREEVRQGVRSWLAAHPPIPIEPKLGELHDEGLWARTVRRIVLPPPEPGQREIRVPIFSDSDAWDDPLTQVYQDVLAFRCISWEITRGNTVVRWKTWEPSRDLPREAEIYGAMSRLKSAFRDAYPIVRRVFEMSADPRVGVAEAALRELSLAVDGWLGVAHVRYLIPGKRPGDAPEARTS